MSRRAYPPPPPFSTAMRPLEPDRQARASRARIQWGMVNRFVKRDGQEFSQSYQPENTLDAVRQETSRLCYTALDEGLFSNSVIAAKKDPSVYKRTIDYANSIAGWVEFADRMYYAR